MNTVDYALSQVLQHGLIMAIALLLLDAVGKSTGIPIEWFMVFVGIYAIHVAGSIFGTVFSTLDDLQRSRDEPAR